VLNPGAVVAHVMAECVDANAVTAHPFQQSVLRIIQVATILHRMLQSQHLDVCRIPRTMMLMIHATAMMAIIRQEPNV